MSAITLLWSGEIFASKNLGTVVVRGFLHDSGRLLDFVDRQIGTAGDVDDDAARAVDKAGLRGVLGETFIDFPVPDHKDLPATLAFMASYVKRWKGHPRITPAAGPSVAVARTLTVEVLTPPKTSGS